MTAKPGILSSVRRVWFSPLDIAWHSAFWAEDPNWTAPGDGSPVAQWDDASGNGRHAAQATAGQRPIYRSAVPDLNNRPALEFDGTDDFLDQAAYAVDITGPSEAVVVAMTTTGESTFINGSVAGKRRSVRIDPGPVWVIAQPTGVTGSTANLTVPHFVDGVFDATDVLTVDGTVVVSADTGTEPLASLRIGANTNTTGLMTGYIAFIGHKDGLLTAQERSDLLVWARTHYGTP